MVVVVVVGLVVLAERVVRKCYLVALGPLWLLGSRARVNDTRGGSCFACARANPELMLLLSVYAIGSSAHALLKHVGPRWSSCCCCSSCCCVLARLLLLFVEEVLCLFVLCLFVCLFFCWLFVCLFVSFFAPCFFDLCLFVCLFVSLIFVCLFVCFFVCLFVCLFDCNRAWRGFVVVVLLLYSFL